MHEVIGAGAGHFANSHLGPVRPTYDPSEHCLASIVQATGEGEGAGFGVGVGIGGGVGSGAGTTGVIGRLKIK